MSIYSVRSELPPLSFLGKRISLISGAPVFNFAVAILLTAICLWHYFLLKHWAQVTAFDIDGVMTYLPYANEFRMRGFDFFWSSDKALHVPPFAYIFPALFGAELVLQKDIAIWMSIFTIVIVCRIGYVVHSSVAGLICAATYALTPNLHPYLPTASVEPLYIFLIATYFWGMCEALQGRRWGIIIAIIGLSLALYTRATALYFQPLVLIICTYCISTRKVNQSVWRTLLTIHLISLSFVVPLLLKNFLQHGLFSVSSGAGIALWFGSHPLTYGMDPSYFNLFSDHQYAHAAGLSHLSAEADASLSALARHVLVGQLTFLPELYFNKLISFMFVSNREWVFPAAELRSWRVLVFLFLLVSVPIIAREPLLWILVAYIAYQILVHLPVLYLHRYSAGAIELPLTVLAGLGISYLLFYGSLRLCVFVGCTAIVLVWVAHYSASNYHYPTLNIDRVSHEVIFNTDGANAVLNGFEKSAKGANVQIMPHATVEFDLTSADKMRGGIPNIIAIDFMARNIQKNIACSNVQIRYRSKYESEFSDGRLFADRWQYTERNRVLIGGLEHIRSWEPGVLQLKFACQGGIFDFKSVQVLQPMVAKRARDEFFIKNYVSDWVQWRQKRLQP
jgi:hypothetical protein